MVWVHCSLGALEAVGTAIHADNEGVGVVSDVQAMVMGSITMSCWE